MKISFPISKSWLGAATEEAELRFSKVEEPQRGAEGAKNGLRVGRDRWTRRGSECMRTRAAVPASFAKATASQTNFASSKPIRAKTGGPALPTTAYLPLPLYSQRSATMGSTFVARRAGTKHATRAAAASMELTTTKSTQSLGLTR